ncbi:hypothetical protein K525DRAFT_215178, partial [Schizophyllum commune Loenen D]
RFVPAEDGSPRFPPSILGRQVFPLRCRLNKDIRVGCAYILLRPSETIREVALPADRRGASFSQYREYVFGTCLDPSWVLGVMGDRCRSLRSRSQAQDAWFEMFLGILA